MGFGRLVRRRAHPHDQMATIYVVAEPEPQKAINILKAALRLPVEYFEDLGRVENRLVAVLKLQSGGYTPV